MCPFTLSLRQGNANLQAFFGDYLTHTIDASGHPFVSSIEGLNAPVYGIAFHPGAAAIN